MAFSFDLSNLFFDLITMAICLFIFLASSGDVRSPKLIRIGIMSRTLLVLYEIADHIIYI